MIFQPNICSQNRMKMIGPDRYVIRLNGRRSTVQGPRGETHFVSPATAKRPKLYTVSAAGEILYVGVTNQPMSTRLRMGLTADGTHGYHGYSWARRDPAVNLDVWYIEESNDAILDIKTIEAESVYLYRQSSGQWPQDQTEIHFHQSNEEHRRCAKQIVEHLKNLLRTRQFSVFLTRGGFGIR
jgi:hypothetical protein